MNGAETLVRSLLASGAGPCFVNPGTSEMHFVAALDRFPEMRAVLALFEGVATGAADGYWRMARQPATTLLHLGPGLANGLANIHNAKKAGSAMVNIVGEHTAEHRALDAPLAADIEGLARPMSHWVQTCETAAEVGQAGADAVTAARSGGGQIATLILPSDTAWNPGGDVVKADPAAPCETPLADAVLDAARALTAPDTLLILGRQALSEAGLTIAGRIAAKTGCALLAEWANARTERGAGRVSIGKLPYPIDAALAVLAPYRRVVLVGAKPPIGFFGYPGKPAVLTRADANIMTLAAPGADALAALEALAAELDAGASPPTGIAELQVPGTPQGAANPETIARAVAASLPENAIVVDESITAGYAIFPATNAAVPHTWLNNCGGSIGYSLPLAIGCAIACPDRKVLTVTGDGSAMYTPQALWTMAREGLDITVVILANRSYQILRGELARVGAGNPGPRAVDMLTLDRPDLDFVAMARSMGVAATRTDDAAAFVHALGRAYANDGPNLIEVIC